MLGQRQPAWRTRRGGRWLGTSFSRWFGAVVFCFGIFCECKIPPIWSNVEKNSLRDIHSCAFTLISSIGFEGCASAVTHGMVRGFAVLNGPSVNGLAFAISRYADSSNCKPPGGQLGGLFDLASARRQYLAKARQSLNAPYLLLTRSPTRLDPAQANKSPPLLAVKISVTLCGIHVGLVHLLLLAS